jgi:hypothetical protein
MKISEAAKRELWNKGVKTAILRERSEEVGSFTALRMTIMVFAGSQVMKLWRVKRQSWSSGIHD